MRSPAAQAPGGRRAGEGHTGGERAAHVTATARAVELAGIAAEAAAEKLATDIIAYDVSEQLVITDVFLLCSAAPPGGRARRALGPPRLPRPRHPYSARRRAHLLRAGAALEGLPAGSAAGAGGGRGPWCGRPRRHRASLTVAQVPDSPGS